MNEYSNQNVELKYDDYDLQYNNIVGSQGNEPTSEGESYSDPLEVFVAHGIEWHVYMTETQHLYYLDIVSSHSQWDDPRSHGIVGYSADSSKNIEQQQEEEEEVQEDEVSEVLSSSRDTSFGTKEVYDDQPPMSTAWTPNKRSGLDLMLNLGSAVGMNRNSTGTLILQPPKSPSAKSSHGTKETPSPNTMFNSPFHKPKRVAEIHKGAAAGTGVLAHVGDIDDEGEHSDWDEESNNDDDDDMDDEVEIEIDADVEIVNSEDHLQADVNSVTVNPPSPLKNAQESSALYHRNDAGTVTQSAVISNKVNMNITSKKKTVNVVAKKILFLEDENLLSSP
jgi:hypothetical protein